MRILAEKAIDVLLPETRKLQMAVFGRLRCWTRWASSLIAQQGVPVCDISDESDKSISPHPLDRFGRPFALGPLPPLANSQAKRGIAPFSPSLAGRVPYLAWPTAGAILLDEACQTTCGEHAKRAPDLLSATMPPEQIADIGAGHAVVASLAQ